VIVNKISLKQEGGQAVEQVQQQSVDPAIQQISDFISQAIGQGQNAAEVVMSLMQQQVDQQIIGQALMMNGFEENDIMSLFEQMSQQQNVSNEQVDPNEQAPVEQEIMQDPGMEIGKLGIEIGKSGIEIKPENEGKFTRWAQARGMSVQEAASKVMSNTEQYPPSVVKMANFAKNAADWNKEDGGENYQKGGVPGKVGAVNNVAIDNKDMNWQRAPLYMNPMAYEYTNDNFNLGKAAAVIGGGYKEFLSGADENKDGVKDGFFRDGYAEGVVNSLKDKTPIYSKKAAIRDATKGNYYNYKITQDANDTNKYVADNTDLFNASKDKGNLRTVDQYGKDIASNSRFNYDTKTHDYNFITSSRPIDKRIYDSDAQKNAMAGKDYNYIAGMDKDTKAMIMGSKDDPAGTRLGIDAKGQASSYAPGANNPYEYNTYMGINKLGQSSMIPTGNNGQPNPGMFNTQPTNTPPRIPQTSFKDWFAQDAVINSKKTQEELNQEYNNYTENNDYRYGGDIMQVGGQPMSKDEWMNQNGRGLIGQELIDENDYQTYVNSINPPAAPQTAGVSSAALPSFAPSSSFLGKPLTMPAASATPTFEPPKVERTNKLQGGINRFLDSPGVQGYGKLSNFAVQGAGVVNDWFRDKNVNQAREDNFNKLGADYQYSTAEDPFNKRGLWDVNTGTAGSEGDRTTGLYLSQYGGENNTADVDLNLLAKLIAAGADIEIL